jgi:hypothetical protein
MLAKLSHSCGRARAFRSLLLVAGSAIFLAGCDRPGDTAAGTESAAARPDSGEPAAVPAADFKSVAAKVVQQSAGVREGDIVLLAGSPEDLPLLEEVAIEVRKLGGHPLVTVNTEQFNRRAYDDVPAKYDSRTPKLALKLAEIADVYISTEAACIPARSAPSSSESLGKSWPD